jgi:hypothetical protein
MYEYFISASYFVFNSTQLLIQTQQDQPGRENKSINKQDTHVSSATSNSDKHYNIMQEKTTTAVIKTTLFNNTTYNRKNISYINI